MCYPNKYAMARFNYFITKSTNVLAKQKRKNTSCLSDLEQELEN